MHISYTIIEVVFCKYDLLVKYPNLFQITSKNHFKKDSQLFYFQKFIFENIRVFVCVNSEQSFLIS